jgi:hypothetical protein
VCFHLHSQEHDESFGVDVLSRGVFDSWIDPFWMLMMYSWTEMRLQLGGLGTLPYHNGLVSSLLLKRSTRNVFFSSFIVATDVGQTVHVDSVASTNQTNFNDKIMMCVMSDDSDE